MADLGELFRDVAADALGVALGRHELRVTVLDALQLDEVPIKLRVAHLGVIERVVGIGGMSEDAIELSRPLRGGLVTSRSHLHVLVDGVAKEGTLGAARLVCHAHPFRAGDVLVRKGTST